MKALEDDGRPIIYADESTFQATAKPGRTWMGRETVVVSRNLQVLQNVTVFGAVCKALPLPVFLTSHTTNAEQFGRFIDHLKEKTRYLRRPELVLDNHRAHKTAENRAAMDQHFEVVFQPAYSSEANCQETVWAVVKHEYRKHLYRRTSNLTTQLRFEHWLQRLLVKVAPGINPARIALANRHWLHAHRELRQRAEYQDLPRPEQRRAAE